MQTTSLADWAPLALSILLVIIARVAVRRWLLAPKQSRLRVEALYVYPVKSCAGIKSKQLQLGRRGFVDDRHWIVVDADGTFQSQREQPRLALVQPSYSDDFAELRLNAPDMPTLTLKRKEPAPGAMTKITLWDMPFPGKEESDEAHAWFARFLRLDGARLVRLSAKHDRPGQYMFLCRFCLSL